MIAIRSAPVQHDIPDLTPEQVAERLRSGEPAVYLDVRTVEEFEEGHPEGALNVPLYARSGRTGMVAENPEFLDVVRAVVPADRTVFCGCAHGVRSLHAAWMLRRAGWERVVNVVSGWDGRRDFLGRVLEPGWRDAGLPVAHGPGGDRSWAELRRRAGAPTDG